MAAPVKVFRPGKTRQDRLPVHKRDRVKDAEARRQAMADRLPPGPWVTDCDLCGDIGVVRDIGGPKACFYCVPGITEGR